MPENTLKNECFQFFLHFVLLFNRSNMETNKKKIPIMIHHLSLSFSRPLCMIAALRLSLAFALGRPVFARLVTSKSAPPPVFPVDPLFLYLYSLSLISIVQSISPPFLLLFSPCFPQSLTTLSVSCSLPASLCFFFSSFSWPSSLFEWIPPVQRHQRHVSPSFTQSGRQVSCQGQVPSGEDAEQRGNTLHHI